MDKIAQKRHWPTKLREALNSPGESVSGMFSPEFTRLMDRLREVDDEAREHAVDLKDILKVAKSNFNRREYMTAITFLGRFHERIDLIKQQFLHLIKETDMVHNEFLFGDLDDEHKKYLSEKMTERFKPKPKAAPTPAGKADDGVMKEAGVKDWWHNLTSDRGKALKSWEKRFPKKAKEIKRQTEKMLSRSEAFLSFTLTTLKSLATLRATRGLEDYLKGSQNFIQKYDAYDAAFGEYFNSSVRSFVESQKEFDKMRAEKATLIKDMQNRPDGEAAPGEAPKGDPGVGSPTITPDGGAGAEPEPTDDILKGLMQGNPPGGDPNAPGHFPPRPFPSPPGGPPDTIRDNTRPGAEEPLPFPGGLDKLDEMRGPLSQMPGPVVNDMTLAPTMLSEREPTPASPPPAMPSMPSVHMPPAARVPTIEETMMPAEKMHMYQPPAGVTHHEGLKPHNTMVGVKPNPTMMGVAPPPSAPQTSREPVSGPITQRSPAPHVPTQTLAYKPLSSLTQEFITNLTKLSGENPLVMATEIIKFAKTIEQTDKKTSDRLLVVARNLLK